MTRAKQVAATWFVRGGGNVYGPLDATRLKRLVAEGKIDESTEVAQAHGGPWYPAGKVRGLFDRATPAPADIPTPQPLQPTQGRATRHAEPPDQVPVKAMRATPAKGDVARTPSKRHAPINYRTLALVGGLCTIASLTIGYFAGREHLRYQMRNSIKDVGKKFAEDLQKGLGEAFAGSALNRNDNDPPPKPVAKLRLGQAHETPQASITLATARMEYPMLKGGLRNTTIKHEEECLVVGLSIRNKESRKQLKLSYGSPFDGSVFSMTDDVDNELDTTFFSSPGSDFSIVGSHPSYEDVDPEQVVEHFVAFRPPLPKTQSLRLLIDQKLIGQEGLIEYDIAIEQVEGFRRK